MLVTFFCLGGFEGCIYHLSPYLDLLTINANVKLSYLQHRKIIISKADRVNLCPLIFSKFYISEQSV